MTKPAPREVWVCEWPDDKGVLRQLPFLNEDEATIYANAPGIFDSRVVRYVPAEAVERLMKALPEVIRGLSYARCVLCEERYEHECSYLEAGHVEGREALIELRAALAEVSG